MLAVLLLLSALASDNPLTERIEGGISPRGPDGFGLRNADCGGCHVRQAAEHAATRHAASATNPIFAAAFAHWPNGWCLGCHAPLLEAQEALLGAPAVPGALRPPRASPPPGAWEDGVGCVVCHVADGAVLSPRPPTASGLDAHPVRHAPELATPEACGRCHEFPFQRHTPKWPFSYGESPSQETITEWRGSRAARAGRDCVDCHFPSGRHTLPGIHAPDFVADAVAVRARRDGDEARVTLSAAAPHRIPTGDVFRRIEVRTCADPACASVVDRDWVRRWFAADEQSFRIVEDDAIPPARKGRSERTVVLDARGACAWQARVRYGDPRFEAALPDSEVGYLLDAGSLPCGREDR